MGQEVFFLFLHKNICCGYSSEVPQRGASDEYPQDMFSWRSKKNIKKNFSWKKHPIWSYVYWQMRFVLLQIYVEYVVKNPLCELGEPVSSDLFKTKLDEYIKALHFFLAKVSWYSYQTKI